MVFTWYIFVNQSTENSVLSIRLDLNGQVDQPLDKRSAADIQALQDQSKTILVLPIQWGNCLELALPWLAERKARQAIPFALEDHFAQPVTQIHFAFDKAHYHNNLYLIVSIEKNKIQTWIQHMHEWGIAYDVITFDWFALDPNQACALDDYILVYAPDFKGAVSRDVWDVYPHEWGKQLQWIMCQESPARSQADPATIVHAHSCYQWIAQGLHSRPYINLCQGEFQHDTRAVQIKRWYRWSGMLAGLWLLSFLAIHGVLYGVLSHRNTRLDAQIAQVYKSFFPDARQVISPRTRVMQLIQKNQMGQDAVLWSLLTRLSQVLASKPSEGGRHVLPDTTQLEGLQFQNQVMTVTLMCDNFAVLEHIETQLKNAHIHVHQVSAATEAKRVAARLELSL